MNYTIHEVTDVIGRAPLVVEGHKAVHQFLKDHPENESRIRITECANAKYLYFWMGTTSSKLGFAAEDRTNIAQMSHQRGMIGEDAVPKLINAVIRALAR